MMGLRKYINDLEFSKKVNYSPRGRKFENSDFARSVELTGMVIKDNFREEGVMPKVEAVCIASLFPISNFVTYGIVKYCKWKRHDLIYNNFSNGLSLILNY